MQPKKGKAGGQRRGCHCSQLPFYTRWKRGTSALSTACFEMEFRSAPAPNIQANKLSKICVLMQLINLIWTLLPITWESLLGLHLLPVYPPSQAMPNVGERETKYEPELQVQEPLAHRQTVDRILMSKTKLNPVLTGEEMLTRHMNMETQIQKQLQKIFWFPNSHQGTEGKMHTLLMTNHFFNATTQLLKAFDLQNPTFYL